MCCKGFYNSTSFIIRYFSPLKKGLMLVTRNNRSSFSATFRVCLLTLISASLFSNLALCSSNAGAEVEGSVKSNALTIISPEEDESHSCSGSKPAHHCRLCCMVCHYGIIFMFQNSLNSLDDNSQGLTPLTYSLPRILLVFSIFHPPQDLA